MWFCFTIDLPYRSIKSNWCNLAITIIHSPEMKSDKKKVLEIEAIIWVNIAEKTEIINQICAHRSAHSSIVQFPLGAIDPPRCRR